MDKVHAFLVTATQLLRAAIQSRALIGTILGVVAFLVAHTGADATLAHIQGLVVTWSVALGSVAALLVVIGRTFADGPLIDFANTFSEALKAIQDAAAARSGQVPATSAPAPAAPASAAPTPASGP